MRRLTFVPVLLALSLATPAPAVVLHPGDVLVSDLASGRIVRVDPVSGAQTLVATVPGGAAGLALDGTGGILVAVPLVPGSIARVDPATGGVVTAFSGGNLNTPNDVTMLLGGVTAVAAVGPSPIGGLLLLDSSGFETYRICCSAEWLGELEPATGQLTDCLRRFNPVTHVSTSIPSTLPGSCTQVAFEADGKLVGVNRFITGTGTPRRLVRLDPATGAWAPLTPPDAAPLVDPKAGIGIEPSGQIVVTSTSNATVVRVDRVTGAQTVLTAGGALAQPYGLVVIPGPAACSNGVDDDGDGHVDFPADPECASPAGVTEAFDCSNGLDDDGDGAIDFPADAGCASAASPRENPQCSNGIDDDGDGTVDLADFGCQGVASRNSEVPAPACGLSAEVAVVLAALAPLRARRRRAPH